MTMPRKDILIGIDAGTSVIKSVAFDTAGRQLAVASVKNAYTITPDGGAAQDMRKTWFDCATTILSLGNEIDNLAQRVLGISVTAQGDGTWLVGRENAPITEGWIWLDARSASLVDQMRNTDADQARYAITATGLNCCQMGAQMAYMDRAMPDLLDQAETALHPKDWLFLNLTGVRASDPSEAVFTFGNYKTRAYDDQVLDALGLAHRKALLPPIIDGSKTTFQLTQDAASQTGLLSGTPVSLGFVDVMCTALGAGIISNNEIAGCTIVGSTGMHMKACSVENVTLNSDLTGYVMQLPIDGMVAQIQSNMASTLNIDWLLGVAQKLMSEFGAVVSHADLVARLDHWIATSELGQILYHPYISDAGERGPFVDARARASFTGLRQSHEFGDLVCAVVEGLGLAARDCYDAMGERPKEIRLTGGAARSDKLREIFSAALGSPVRRSMREEAGAAGAAMMAAVANGVYRDMNACIAEWVTPHLSEAEAPNDTLAETYDALMASYRHVRRHSDLVWNHLAKREDS